ncbi:MAG: RnfABCDGE type electron transport complex subunit G [Kiritimatiellia bacterium]
MSSETSSVRLVLSLGGIAVFSGVLLALTFELTKPVIARKEQLALEAAVFQVLPGAVRSENYQLDDAGLRPLAAGESAPSTLVAGLDGEGRRIGFALTGAARGYADVIRVLYGYDPEKQQIVGLQVLSSNETPGLGDKIAKDPAFQSNFTALDASLTHEIETVKNGEKTEAWQIDGISGATVSSKAVGKALRESTREWLPKLKAALEDES